MQTDGNTEKSNFFTKLGFINLYQYRKHHFPTFP
jgi:hypothetical protein